MNSDEEIFIAKKTAERAGYKVSAPSQLDIAKKTAERAGYTVAKQKSVADKFDLLAQAARTAERAGYTVRKANPNAQARPAVQSFRAAEKEEEVNPLLRGATKFMPNEND